MRAKMTGIGKLNTSISTLRNTVFERRFTKYAELKKRWKFCNPTQGLPQIPRAPR
jgi:hypothetical protein